MRFDAGVQTGSDVSVHYDPILGKLVVWAEDRPAAIQRMTRALRDNVVLGVTTTTEFMLDVLAHPDFVQGQTTTSFVDEQMADWAPATQGDLHARLGYLADRATGAGRQATAAPTTGGTQSWLEPWHSLGAWDLLE